MRFLDTAVDDADGRRISIGCDRRDGMSRLRALLALVLGQRDVFRFDDFEDVGIVQDKSLSPFPEILSRIVKLSGNTPEAKASPSML